VAILGTVLATVYRSHLNLNGLADSISEVAKKGVSAGMAVADKIHSPELLDSALHSFVAGMDALLWVCALISAIGIALALVFLPRMEAKAIGELKADPI